MPSGVTTGLKPPVNTWPVGWVGRTCDSGVRATLSGPASSGPDEISSAPPSCT